MNSRQRGAAVVLAAFLAGRLLDRFDLPFENGLTAVPAARESVPSESGALAAHAPESASHAAVETTAVSQSARIAAPAAGAATSAAGATTSAATTDSSAPLAINRATAADLERLPGVGPVLAARIVAERERSGLFRDLTDLRRVRGIGAKTAARLAPRLRFD